MSQISPQINGFIPENSPATLGFPVLLGYRIEEISGYFSDSDSRFFYIEYPVPCIMVRNSKKS
jgi:hypothetical protein